MKRILITACAVVLTMSVFGRPQTRGVVVDTICNAPVGSMLQAAERFCRQFQKNATDSLEQWAYKGIAEREKAGAGGKPSKESSNAIQLVYKDRMYDPVSKTGDITIDIYVLGVRWWKDQHLGTRYTLSQPDSERNTQTAHMTATYSGSILEGGDVIFRLEPIDERHTRVHYEFNLTFGKVLSAFISDKTWHNAIEWRFETILANLVEYAETGTVRDKKQE